MNFLLNYSSITQSNQAKRMSYESANPEFHVPHKPYYLRETTNALQEICSVTNNLQTVPDQFKMLESQLQLPYKADMIYGQFDAPANIAVIQKVNGVDGFFLKKTIHETAIDFIWFQKEHCQYLFWGVSKEQVIDAMNRIRSRIIKCVKNYKQKEEEEAEVCPPSPLPIKSRPVVGRRNVDISGTPPPASEYMSRQDSVWYSSPSLNYCTPKQQSHCERAHSPSPPIQQIFRSMGEAHYYDSD